MRVLSVVVTMRDAFSDTPHRPYCSTSPHLLLSMLSGVFATLTTAMRYEPANAKFFHAEVTMIKCITYWETIAAKFMIMK